MQRLQDLWKNPRAKVEDGTMELPLTNLSGRWNWICFSHLETFPLIPWVFQHSSRSQDRSSKASEAGKRRRFACVWGVFFRRKSKFSSKDPRFFPKKKQAVFYFPGFFDIVVVLSSPPVPCFSSMTRL